MLSSTTIIFAFIFLSVGVSAGITTLENHGQSEIIIQSAGQDQQQFYFTDVR